MRNLAQPTVRSSPIQKAPTRDRKQAGIWSKLPGHGSVQLYEEIKWWRRIMVLHWTVYNDTIHNDHGILSLVHENERLRTASGIIISIISFVLIQQSKLLLNITHYNFDWTWPWMTSCHLLATVVLGVARKSSWHNHGMRLASMRLLIIVRNSDKLSLNK